MPHASLKQPTQEYGIMPLIWRRLRAVSGGCCDLDLYGRDGEKIGVAHLERYLPRVHIPAGMSFKAISWITTIKHVKEDPAAEAAFIGKSEIAIGQRSFM